MNTMTGRLLRRNRHLLGAAKASSTLVSQAMSPLHSQLQPSTKGFSERDAAGEDIEDQNTESIVQTAPTFASGPSGNYRHSDDSQLNAIVRDANSSVNFKDIKDTVKVSRLLPQPLPQEVTEKGQKDIKVDVSKNGAEPSQNRPSKDEQLVAGQKSGDMSIEVPASVQNEDNNIVELKTKVQSSKLEPVKSGQADRPYIAQLKQIKAMYEADYAEQGSRISRVEAELATSSSSSHKPAAKAQQKQLLPNRNLESLVLPQQAKPIRTLINIGAINVEVIEPKASMAITPTGARRQAKLSSRRTYRGQSGTRKHFGFGQL